MAELVIWGTIYAFILLFKLLKFFFQLLFKLIGLILKGLAIIFMFPGTKYSGDVKEDINQNNYYYDDDEETNQYQEEFKKYLKPELGDNCYEILGVSPDDDLSTIKQVYRNLSKAYHPDVNKSKLAEEKVKKVNDAWDQIQKARGEKI